MIAANLPAFQVAHGTPGRHRRAGRRQRGHRVSRVLNDKPGVSDRPAGRADRAGRPRLRATHAAAPAERGAGRAGRARAGEPDLPGFRAGDRGRLAGRRYTPVLCTQSPGGVTEDEYVECCSTTASPASSSSPACTPTPRRPRPLPRAGRPRAAGRLRQRLRRRHRGAVHLHRRPQRHADGGQPPRAARPRADRPRRRAGPLRAVPAQARGLRRRRRALGTSPRPSRVDGSRRALFSVEGGAAAAGRLLERGATRSSAART